MNPFVITLPNINYAKFLRAKLEDVQTRGTQEALALLQVCEILDQTLTMANTPPPPPPAPKEEPDASVPTNQ
jgi:hypothetical protein